ncbi:hypothetical protein LC55x_0140 [Lysobacter capsici]|nr:hypothetical protein LC55x_0140 [Lysobacter capsici]
MDRSRRVSPRIGRDMAGSNQATAGEARLQRTGKKRRVAASRAIAAATRNPAPTPH